MQSVAVSALVHFLCKFVVMVTIAGAIWYMYLSSKQEGRRGWVGGGDERLTLHGGRATEGDVSMTRSSANSFSASMTRVVGVYVQFMVSMHCRSVVYE